MIIGHGGNIYNLARRHGCSPSEIIDMSSNMNPLGPPGGLLRFLKENVHKINALPEVDAGSAVNAFAAEWGIDTSRVLAGNGTTQFIFSIPQAIKSKKALIVGPTYSDYADACKMHGVSFNFIFSNETSEFRPDLTAIAASLNGYDTAFICNSNNPTGILIPSDDLVSLTSTFPDIRFVIDESYLPFADRSESESLISRNLENVIVLNSMSKIFCIPGLRIGFAVSSEAIIQQMKRYALPWCVNSLSQAAVIYLMEEKTEIKKFLENTRAFLKIERNALMEKLKVLSHLHVFPSSTSFFLAKMQGKYTAESVCTALAEKKVLIRNCSNFVGLSNRFIRLSLKSSDNNQMAGDMLAQIVDE